MYETLIYSYNFEICNKKCILICMNRRKHHEVFSLMCHTNGTIHIKLQKNGEMNENRKKKNFKAFLTYLYFV